MNGWRPWYARIWPKKIMYQPRNTCRHIHTNIHNHSFTRIRCSTKNRMNSLESHRHHWWCTVCMSRFQGKKNPNSLTIALRSLEAQIYRTTEKKTGRWQIKSHLTCSMAMEDMSHKREQTWNKTELIAAKQAKRYTHLNVMPVQLHWMAGIWFDSTRPKFNDVCTFILLLFMYCQWNDSG